MTEKHVSAVERFTDSGFETIPWTRDLAIGASGADYDAPEGDQRAIVEDAAKNGEIPKAALDAFNAGT